MPGFSGLSNQACDRSLRPVLPDDAIGFLARRPAASRAPDDVPSSRGTLAPAREKTIR
jgi:hypothetical protein